MACVPLIYWRDVLLARRLTVYTDRELILSL